MEEAGCIGMVGSFESVIGSGRTRKEKGQIVGSVGRISEYCVHQGWCAGGVKACRVQVLKL